VRRMIKLFNYQIEGVKFLESKRFAMLADEMGLGKTAQTIHAALSLKSKRILVICPAVALYNWQKEFRSFGNIDSEVFEPGSVPRRTDYHNQVLITSFDRLSLYLDKFTRRSWDVVIVDEAHFLKTPTAKRTLAILGKLGVLHYTKRMWALTGTPAPNHAGELWTWLFTFGYTKLSYEGFIARYCNAHHIGGNRYSRVQITGSNTKHTPELKTILKKFVLRRLKKDVLKQLPPIWHQVHYIKPRYNEIDGDLKTKLTQEWAKLSQQIDFDHIPNDDKLLSALQAASQSLSSLRRYHGITKVDQTAELIDGELKNEQYDKLVVFGVHTDVIEGLMRRLNSRYKSVVITGATPPKQRQEAVDRFQNDPECKLFYGNIQAAGTAVTLTASHNVLFIEQDWVPGSNAQAAMRCHRIGQERPVTVRHVCIADSLDAKITGTLMRKTQELSTFI